MKVKYINRISAVKELQPGEATQLEPVTREFAFRTNDYYNSLINWEDPNDPIRRLVVPVMEEMIRWGQLDASDERTYQPVPGVEHKYKDTVLLLCNDVCAAYCRFCFRKRLFQPDNDEVVKDVSEGVAYIRSHGEVDNVLLTGGDPLVMSTSKLERIISELCQIPHLQYIRIGTKIPAFNPYRVLDDPALLEMIETYSRVKRIYIMAHFNHVTELTDVAVKALEQLMKAGASVVNQTPIIAGVNDSAVTLENLFKKLAYIGIQPYYVFACRPTLGNKTFAVPIERAFELYEEAKRNCSGLAKTARFIMSHKTGKIEVVGLADHSIVFKYHNVVDCQKNGKIFQCARNPEAYWLDDYTALAAEGAAGS